MAGDIFTLKEFMKNIDEEVTNSIDLVISKFSDFLTEYKEFKKLVGLPETLKNPLESVVGASDKVGRLIRYVKHNIRQDPKPDWERLMQEEMFGAIAYLVILMEESKFDDISVGMRTELIKAAEQHARK